MEKCGQEKNIKGIFFRWRKLFNTAYEILVHANKQEKEENTSRFEMKK